MKSTICGLLIASAVMLVGCGSPPTPMKTYSLPDKNMPHAIVLIDPRVKGITRDEFDCSPDGEYLAHHTYRLQLIAALPPGESQFFAATAPQSDWSCAWSFAAELEAGKTYQLTASLQDNGFLKGKTCPLSLVDTATNTSPPIYFQKGSTHIGKEACRRRADRAKTD